MHTIINNYILCSHTIIKLLYDSNKIYFVMQYVILFNIQCSILLYNTMVSLNKKIYCSL